MPRRRLVWLLFFLSGAAGLAYEVIWIRLLSLSLSITVHSLTTVLCAFMAGLALGSGIASAVADRIRRPLVAFALAELAIALCGLAIPPLLFGLGPAVAWLHAALGGEGALLGVARFLLAGGILLVPCTWMGFTLPVLSRAMIDREGVAGGQAGALYAANTLGAVVGCTTAGFVVIPALGLRSASAAAACLNLGVAAAAFALGFRHERGPIRAARADGSLPRTVWLGAAVFGLSGFAAMGYEVLWTRTLEHYTHNSTYAYTAMLGVFLAGLALGSAAMARIADRMASPRLGLAAVQILIALSVVGGLRVFMGFETLVPAAAEALGGLASWPRVVALIFGEAGVTMFATTLLLGAVFPLVVRLAAGGVDGVGRAVGLVYLANTLGSIAGAVAVGFWLLPALGVRGAFVALVFLNLALAALIGVRERRPARWGVLAAAAATGFAALAVLPEGLLRDRYAARFGRILFYREEVTDTVMVTEAPDGSRMIRYADGRGTAGTPTFREDRMYAHVPLLLHPGPRRVLQIGFGVGNTLSSTLVHPVAGVDCVELSPGVVDAEGFFRATNRDPLADPRVRLVIGDGRHFVLTSRERYDVIRMDPPELHTAGVVNLYTREFFELVRERLAPGGLFSVWINAVMTPIDDIRLLLRTLAHVFPHVSVWTGPAQYSWVMNASLEPHDPDLRRLAQAFAVPELRADLATIGIDSPFGFVDHFVLAGKAVAEFAGDGPQVTDDHTRLDFSVPRSADAYYGIANYNTNAWLVEQMDPSARSGVAERNFLAKVARLRAERRPVLPHLRNVEAAGYEPGELARILGGGAAAPSP